MENIYVRRAKRGKNMENENYPSPKTKVKTKNKHSHRGRCDNRDTKCKAKRDDEID